MKFVQVIKVILGFQFITGALSEGWYLIDTTSCTGDFYNAVKGYMDSAQKWAEEICDILEPYIQDPSQRPNDRFMDLAFKMFGNNDLQTMMNVHNNRNPWWTDQERDPGDLEIFCSADHIVHQDNPASPDAAWWDITRDSPVDNDDIALGHKDPKGTLLATAHVAVPDGDQEKFPQHWSEYIVINPYKLRKAVDKGTLFADKRVRKASSPSLLSRIRRAYNWHWHDITPVDILKTLDINMIHELSHLVACGDAIDVRGDDSYGWDNALAIRQTDNSETLTFFVIIDQLNRHYNLDVDDNGKIVKIT
ncbi:hypothetical protein PG991_014990 [Apiospora marii]|uniref:Uncharacterized protein n=1 Tax=Apiospora marii TaxID=335849 RepID=A0ABR1R3J0_9PEZI